MKVNNHFIQRLNSSLNIFPWDISQSQFGLHFASKYKADCDFPDVRSKGISYRKSRERYLQVVIVVEFKYLLLRIVGGRHLEYSNQITSEINDCMLSLSDFEAGKIPVRAFGQVIQQLFYKILPIKETIIFNLLIL